MQARDDVGLRAGVPFALAAAFGFSFKAVLVKLAYAWPVEAITLLALRMLFSLPAFAAVAIVSSRGSPRLSWRDVRGLLVLGLLGYYGASVLDFIGLRYISPGLERLILFTYPTITMLLGALMHRQVITAREVTAVALCYGGVGLAFAHDVHVGSDVGAVLMGSAFVFGSSLTFAFYLVGSGTMIARLGTVRFTSLAMIVSTGGTLLHYVLAAPLDALFVLPWQVYALAAAMAAVSTVAPVFMQSAAIRRLGASRAALIGSVGPILTISLSWWLLDEVITAWQLAGAAFVVWGVLRIARPR